MKKKGIIGLYAKGILLLSPLIVIILSFIVVDPFQIIHSNSGKYETSDDVLSTERYLKNTTEKHYTAFLFGNSKALAFLSSDWKKHIGGQEVFKFAAPGESIFNIYNKLKLIERSGDSIKHALLVIDQALINNFKNSSSYLKGPVYKHHPYTQDESWLAFYTDYFGFYLADGFFVKTILDCFKSDSKNNVKDADFKITKEYYDPLTNEFILQDLENEICNLGFKDYYAKHFVNYNSISSSVNLKPDLLNPEDIYYLREIRTLFNAHGTKYKIVAGPVWKGSPINKNAIMSLKDVFGKETVFDYSGENKYSLDSAYFYENAHYRPLAGAMILNEIYEDSVEIGVRYCTELSGRIN